MCMGVLLCLHRCLCVHWSLVHMEVRRGHQTPGSGVTDGCEQPVFLTAEPSSQPPTFIFFESIFGD